MSPGGARAAWGRGIVRHRGAATLVVLAVTLLAVAAIGWRVHTGFVLDFTPQALFMDDSAEMDRLREIEATFGREDNDVLVVVDQRLDTSAGWEALRALHQALEAHPRIDRVDSLLNAVVLEGGDGVLRITALDDAPDPGQRLDLATIDPVLRGAVVSADGNLAVLRARIDPGIEQVTDLAPVLDDVAAIVAATPLPATVTGVPFVRVEVVDMMVQNQLQFLPVCALLFAVASMLLFRRMALGLAPLVTVLIADTWALAVLMAAGVEFNVLSVLVPTLVVVVGISDGIHLTARYREELAHDGDPEAAMGRTTHAMTVALLLTTLTTAAGFGSLWIADTAVVRSFGLHAAIAIVVALLAILLALPTWLAWLPPKAVSGSTGGVVHGAVQTGLARTDTAVRRAPWRTLAFSGLVIGIAAWLGSGVRPNSTILEMYHPGHPTWTAIHQIDDQLGGIAPVFVHVAGPPGSLLEPQVLAAMDTLESELRSRPEVRWSASPGSWLRRLNHILTDVDAVPDSRAAAAQELLLAELSGELPLAGVLTEDHSQGRIMLRVADAGGNVILDMAETAEARADALFAGTGVSVEVSGDGIMASRGIDQLVTDLLSSISVVLGVILLTMLVLLRDLRLALLAVVPNLVPLVFTAATLGLLGVDLQITTIVAFTVSIGLAVDDTIHFIVRYREEKRRAPSRAVAITRTFSGAGSAIVLTSVLLVAGFGVLGTSELASSKWFGILSAVTMVAAVFADLLVLPALLHLVDRDRPENAA